MDATDTQTTRVVPAVSVDAVLAARMPGEVRLGVVHSVHEQVVNLRDGNGSLCCLSTTSIEDAPRTVRIDAATWEDLCWRRGDPVSFGPDFIQALDGTRVELTGARRWSPPAADLSRLTPADLRSVAAAIETRLPQDPSGTSFQRVSAPVLDRCASALFSALCHQDPASVTAVAQSLVGLGAGLTPSGDDLLVGLGVLAAARGMQIGAFRSALTEALVAGPALETRTTAVSAATLIEAAAGRARDRIHRLLTVISSFEPADGPAFAAALAAADDVRAIGHTSGADVLRGVRLGLVAEAHLRETSALLRSSPRLLKETP